MAISEYLIILEESDVERNRASFEAAHRIAHSVSRRMFVVQGLDTDSSQLTSRAGVLVATQDEVPTGVRLKLSDSEQIWLNAWRLSKQPKTRTGKEQSWDSPGFQAPDKPRKE